MRAVIVADAVEARRRLAGRAKLPLFEAYMRLHMPDELFERYQRYDEGLELQRRLPADFSMMRGYTAEAKWRTKGVLLLLDYRPRFGGMVYCRAAQWEEDFERLCRIAPIVYQ
ncbi:hypothetical protein ACWX0K_14805 [Nitrobacteraceae bacterium UC4446_H13]